MMVTFVYSGIWNESRRAERIVIGIVTGPSELIGTDPAIGINREMSVDETFVIGQQHML